MKERPILFSGPMVRAILTGRKTQTRRILKPQRDRDGFLFGPDYVANEFQYGDNTVRCPYGQPGDRLWVREAWTHCDRCGRTDYQADVNKPRNCRHCDASLGNWKPSIHMFREASRITLEIISIRAERLNDISEEDAKAEGIHKIAHGRSGYYYSAFNKEPDPKNWCHPCSAYKELWESINGRGSWDLNPWVWVVEFKEVKP